LQFKINDAVEKIEFIENNAIVNFKRYRPKRKVTHEATQILYQIYNGVTDIESISSKMPEKSKEKILEIIRILEKERIILIEFSHMKKLVTFYVPSFS